LYWALTQFRGTKLIEARKMSRCIEAKSSRGWAKSFPLFNKKAGNNLPILSVLGKVVFILCMLWFNIEEMNCNNR